MEMNNEVLEQACNIDERETTIALMPKWLAELDLINLFIQRKKEIEEKIKVGIKTIGEYDCQIFSIKNKHEEKTIIKESKTISEDLNKKLDDFKKIAEENNDLVLLEKINSIKDDFDKDKKVSYAKPQAKIKELSKVLEQLNSNGNNENLDNIIEIKTSDTLTLTQKQHIEFVNETTDDVLKEYGKNFVC